LTKTREGEEGGRDLKGTVSVGQFKVLGKDGHQLKQTKGVRGKKKPRSKKGRKLNGGGDKKITKQKSHEKNKAQEKAIPSKPRKGKEKNFVTHGLGTKKKGSLWGEQ